MAPSLRETLARAAYSTLLRLVTPLYLARLWWRGRHEPAYRLAWRERLGGMDSASGEPPSGRLWLHAVSLGETRAAAALFAAACGLWCISLGVVDASFLQDKEQKVPNFVLAGRPWRILGVDWKGGTCSVEPAEVGGYPRWFGLPWRG